MKLRIVTFSILLASGLLSLTLQAQEPPQIIIPGGPKETQDVELINDSNEAVYYSLGEAVDPRLRAENFPLERLEVGGIISGKRSLAPQQRTRFEAIVALTRPDAPRDVKLFSFTPGKTIFIRVVKREGTPNLEPQVPVETSFLDRLRGRSQNISRTGRDLSNNVTVNDIRSDRLRYIPKAQYTPPLLTQSEDTTLEARNILLKLPNIDNELKAIIRRIVEPGATVYDILGLPHTATVEAVADAHQALILALADLNIPEAQDLINRVQKIVNQYYQQQFPGARPAQPAQPTQPRPGEPGSQIAPIPRPVLPEPSAPEEPGIIPEPSVQVEQQMRAIVQRIRTEPEISGKVGAAPNTPPNELIDRVNTITNILRRDDIIQLLNQLNLGTSQELISILEKSLNQYFLQQPTQQVPIPAPQRPSVPEREVTHVVGSGGLTNEEVDTILKIRVTPDEYSQFLLNLHPERLQEAKNSYQDLQTRALSTNFVDKGLRSEVLEQINTFLQLINQEIQNRSQQQPAPQPELTRKDIATISTGRDLITILTNILGTEAKSATPEQINKMYLDLRNRIIEAPERDISRVNKPTYLNKLDELYKQYSQKVISTQTFNITPESTIYQILNLPENTDPQVVRERALDLIQQLFVSDIPEADKANYIQIILNAIVRDIGQQPINQHEIQRINNATSIQGALGLSENASPAAVRIQSEVLSNRINATQLPEDITKSLFGRFSELYKNYAAEQMKLRGNTPEIRLLLPPTLPTIPEVIPEAKKEQAEVEKQKGIGEPTLRFVEERLNGGLTDSQVARILQAQTCRAIFGLPPGATIAQYLDAFNDLVGKNTQTEYIHPSDRDEVLRKLIIAGQIITNRLRQLGLAGTMQDLTFEQEARELAETSQSVSGMIKTYQDMTRYIQQLQKELNEAFDKYMKAPEPVQPGPSGQPGPSIQPEVRPEQQTGTTIAGREIDPEIVIKRILGHLNNIRTLESQIQATSRRPVSHDRNQELEKLQRQLNTYQKMSTQEVLRTAFGIPGIYQVTNPTDIENIKRIRDIVALEALEQQPDRERVLEMLNELVQTLIKQQS